MQVGRHLRGDLTGRESDEIQEKNGAHGHDNTLRGMPSVGGAGDVPALRPFPAGPSRQALPGRPEAVTIPPMINWLKSLFGGKGILVHGGAGIDEGTARSIDVGDPLAGGKRVLLSKVDGQVYALDSLCPHGEGGYIQTGPLEGGRYLLCPLHRYQFDPKTGKAHGVVCASARRYRVKVVGDDLEVFA